MEKRQFQRHEVDVEVDCFIHGEKLRLFVYDICVDGCMVDTGLIRLDLGDRVSFRLLPELGLEGTVVWRQNGNAGLKFGAHLHPALVVNLGVKLAAPSIDDLPPQDRFGRRLPGLQLLSRHCQKDGADASGVG